MGIDISVLMGANIANEVAAEKFCETTIGNLFNLALLILKNYCIIRRHSCNLHIYLRTFCL